jgi:hypothetical protein
LQELKDYIESWLFFDSVRYIDANSSPAPSTTYYGPMSQINMQTYNEMDFRGNLTSKFLEFKHSNKPKDTINAMEVVAKIFDLVEIKSTEGDGWPKNINTFSEDKNKIESPIELMGSGFQLVLIIASTILLRDVWNYSNIK